jgi:hypothetical protein
VNKVLSKGGVSPESLMLFGDLTFYQEQPKTLIALAKETYLITGTTAGKPECRKS